MTCHVFQLVLCVHHLPLLPPHTVQVSEDGVEALYSLHHTANLLQSHHQVDDNGSGHNLLAALNILATAMQRLLLCLAPSKLLIGLLSQPGCSDLLGQLHGGHLPHVVTHAPGNVGDGSQGWAIP